MNQWLLETIHEAYVIVHMQRNMSTKIKYGLSNKIMQKISYFGLKRF